MRHRLLRSLLFVTAVTLFFVLLTVSASAGAPKLAVAGEEVDVWGTDVDIFGDGTAVYSYHADTATGYLTLTDFSDRDKPHGSYLDVWAGEGGATSEAYFSVVGTGELPVCVIVTGDTYIRNGITLQVGTVYFDRARVTFGPACSCGAVVHGNGGLSISDSTLTVEGFELLNTSRPDSNVCAYFFGYDVEVTDSTVTCEAEMSTALGAMGFLHARRNLYLLRSRVSLDTDKYVFAGALRSDTGLIQCEDSQLDIRGQVCAVWALGNTPETTGEPEDLAAVNARGTVALQNTRMYAEGYYLLHCRGLACLQSQVSGSAWFDGITVEGDAERHVIFRNSEVDLCHRVQEGEANRSFGLKVSGGSIVLADGSYAFSGFGCGIAAVGQTQFSLEKKVVLRLKADTCAFFLAPVVEDAFNPTVRYRAAHTQLSETDLPASLSVPGVGRTAVAMTDEGRALVYLDDESAAPSGLWDVVASCRGIAREVTLRTQGKYLGTGWVILLSFVALGAAVTGAWFLGRRLSRRQRERDAAPFENRG